MKIKLENLGLKKEIHPFWLRERANGDSFVDKGTQQRLFDPTKLKENIQIDNLNLSNDYLEISFNDGVYTKLDIENILREFSNINDVKHIKKIKWDSSLKNLNDVKHIKKIKWDSSLKNFNNFEYKDDFFEKEEMLKALIIFYEYGFVIFKRVPTKNNFKQKNYIYLLDLQ